MLALILYLAATDRNWGQVPGSHAGQPCVFGAPDGSILAHKKEHSWTSFWLGMGEEKKGSRPPWAPAEECRGEGGDICLMLAAWNIEIILNEAAGFIRKDHLGWKFSVLPILCHYQRTAHRVIHSRGQPTYLNVNDNNYWPRENLLIQLKYFTNIIGRICVGLAVLLTMKSFYQG